MSEAGRNGLRGSPRAPRGARSWAISPSFCPARYCGRRKGECDRVPRRVDRDHSKTGQGHAPPNSDRALTSERALAQGFKDCGPVLSRRADTVCPKVSRTLLRGRASKLSTAQRTEGKPVQYKKLSGTK